MTETAKNFPQVLEFCNKVREAGGGRPLNALLPAIPQDSEACLIAKNLNFECSVHHWNAITIEEHIQTKQELGSDYENFSGIIWAMYLRDADVRDKIAAALDLPRRMGLHHVDGRGTITLPCIILPAFIAETAEEFDEAWDEWAENEYELEQMGKLAKYVAFFATKSDDPAAA